MGIILCEILGVIVGIVSLGATLRIHNVLRKFHTRKLYSGASLLHELPSVSICIPARNEKHVMASCLERVLASTYPKMEVIVLDDSSTDGTSALIRSFAHEGVRFIEGKPLESGWLGKNYALQTLAQEANGRYIIFMDVDTELGPETVGQLVAHMQGAHLTMLSALPQRSSATLPLLAGLAPLRYFWTILLHSSSRPACTSSLWMVQRTALMADGGFEKLHQDIEPEVSLAAKHSGSYHFLLSHRLLQLTYSKTLASQYETVLRLRFPILRYSVFICCLSMVFQAISLTSVVCLIWLQPLLGIVILTAACFPFLLYSNYAMRWPTSLIATMLFPLLFAIDTVLSGISMKRYLTHSVTWKGRSIRPRNSKANNVGV